MAVVGFSLHERLRRVRDVSRGLSQVADLEALFSMLHQRMPGVLSADTFLLALYDEHSRTIQVVRQAEFDVELPGGAFPLGHGLTSEVIRTRQPRLVRNWSNEAPPVQLQYVSGTPGLPESAVMVPLLTGEQVTGVLAAHSYSPDAFDEDDLLVLEAIAAQTATAIEGLRRSEHLAAQLQERVSQLQAVLGSLAEPLLMIDAQGCITELNDAARAVLCIDDASVVLGQPLEQQVWGQWPLGSAEISDAIAPMVRGLLRGDPVADCEVRLERHGRRVLKFSGRPLLDARGNVGGAVLVVRDVTARNEIEQLKYEMLSVASHDLKTPVTVIRSQAQLLRRNMRDGSIARETIDNGLATIVGQTDRLTKLLALLLDLSRIEAGRFTIDKRPTNLASVASSVIADVAATTDRHQIRLHTSGPVSGNWDDDRLGELLTNLLTNAIKYAPEGGLIDVEIRGHDNEVAVCVRDQGLGLAPDEAAHVFERFFRAESSRRLEGSGLGLYICQSVVSAHGGRIWVESPGLGQGSSFCFVLPRG